MWKIESPQPVMPVVAAFSRHSAALDWARDWCVSQFGTIVLESPRFEHQETSYYDQQMGAGLRKTFFACKDLAEPAQLSTWKLVSNQAEMQLADQNVYPEPRPLNLDPGYLTASKFVLATTKDHAHRIYLQDGIYAEITLKYFKGQWTPWDWTYPDYRRADYQQYFSECRTIYRQLLNPDHGG